MIALALSTAGAALMFAASHAAARFHEAERRYQTSDPAIAPAGPDGQHASPTSIGVLATFAP